MDSTTRRDVLVRAGRYVTLGVLVGGLGLLVGRDGDPCDAGLPCARCRQVGTCDRPDAQAARASHGDSHG